MPVKKPAGGVNPIENTTTSVDKFPFTPKSWFSDRLLILVSTVFLLVLLLFLGLSPYGKTTVRKILTQTPSEKIGLGDTSKLFANTYDLDRFNKFIAANELTKAFVFLSGEYDSSPSNRKRDALIKLASYIKANIVDQTKAVDLTIPCREESCGAKLHYPNELLEIKQKVENDPVFAKTEKEVILINLENAAIAFGANNKDEEFNKLLIIFQDVKDVLKRTGSASVRELASKLQNLMKQINPEVYGSASQSGILELD